MVLKKKEKKEKNKKKGKKRNKFILFRYTKFKLKEKKKISIKSLYTIKIIAGGTRWTLKCFVGNCTFQAICFTKRAR